MFGVVKITKNVYPDKYACTGYGIGYVRVYNFHYLIVASVKMSLFLELIWAHLCTLIIRKGLDDSTLTAEAQYSFNFSRSNRKFCLSLHYNGSNGFLIVNATKIYQFKAKDSEIKKISLAFRKYFKRSHS